jgi:taurine dioxygenase
MALSVRPLSDRLGAEISSIDLSREMDSESWNRLYRAYLDYKLLSIRGQSLTAQQFQNFGERFGPPDPHPVAMFHHPESKNITILSNRLELGRPKGLRDAGSHWHSDYSYKAVPANATLLYALEVPQEGGDTLFCDLVAAYETLPESLKTRILNRYAKSQYRWSHDRKHPESRWLFITDEEREKTPEVAHPVVRLHPETGMESIYVFPGITSGTMGIVGLSDKESETLLEAVYAHITQEKFQLRYQWKPGDVVVWDNRATMHRATTDELPPERYRTLWRITTVGSVPLPG